MYFYILDGSHSPTLRLADRLKRELSGYGIAGEITKTDPRLTPKFLVETGRLKGYTTIIAVGTDEHINAVAHALIMSDVAFGFIPMTEGSRYATLIGVRHWLACVPILRSRYTSSVAVGETDLGSIFLDRVTVLNPAHRTVRLTFPAYSLELTSHQLTIKNGGLNEPQSSHLLVETDDREPGFVAAVSRLLARGDRPSVQPSRLLSMSLAITADPELEVRLDASLKVNLPLALRIRPKALRAIINRRTERPIKPSNPLNIDAAGPQWRGGALTKLP